MFLENVTAQSDGQLRRSVRPAGALSVRISYQTYSVPYPSTFNIVALAPQLTVSQRPFRQLPHLPADQPPCRILVADDHPVNRTLLVRVLRRCGFIVSQAANGAEAFDRWQTWHPHLIFMDLLMPGTNGHEATHLIRTAETLHHRPATKIIALTAEPLFLVASQVAVSNPVTGSGFDSIVAKPVRSDLILDLVAKSLNLKYVYNYEAAVGVPSSRSVL